MPANWGSFQSAIQLAAGTNIALYALLNLGQPAIETEAARWKSLVEDARYAGDQLRLEVGAGRTRFHDAIQELSDKASVVRRLALWVAAVATVVLLRASCWPDDSPNSPLLWGTLVVGAVPAVVLAGVNVCATRLIERISEHRRALQSRCNAGQ